MEVGQQSTSRRRTESTSGSSDSELSEGWNIIDELEVMSQGSLSRSASREEAKDGDNSSKLEMSKDWKFVSLEDANHQTPPSSDGESVEVIETEDDSPQSDSELEQEVAQAEEAFEMINDSLLPGSMTERGTFIPCGLSYRLPDIMAEKNDDELPEHENTFDSSFCWLLLISAFVMLYSSLAYIATGTPLNWEITNMLRTTYLIKDFIPPSAPLPGDINYMVEVFKGGKVNNYKNSEQFLEKTSNSKRTLKTENREIGRYFKLLSHASRSAETQNKFAQTVLILDALYIGLRDLEESVSDHSELHQLLKRQQSKLHNVSADLELRVERSMSKLASSILNKVRKLERKFENQWCRKQKNLDKVSLRNFLYNCEDEYEDSENNEAAKHQQTGDKMHEKKHIEQNITVSSLQYKVDNDPNTEGKGSKEYYKLVESTIDYNKKYSKKYSHKQSGKYADNNKTNLKGWRWGNGHLRQATKIYIPTQETNPNKSIIKKELKKILISFLKKYCVGNIKINVEDVQISETFHDLVYKEYCRQNDGNTPNSEVVFKVTNYFVNQCKKIQKTGESSDYKTRWLKNGFESERLISQKLLDAIYRKICLQSLDESAFNRTTTETAKKYLKDTCDKNLKTKKLNNYEELKDKINKKVKISKHMFDDFYDQNCKPTMDKYTLEIVTKYLIHSCQKNVNSHHPGKQSNDYHKLKKYIDRTVNIPKESFNELYEQYCKQNYDSPPIDKATVEAVSKHLKEKCQKTINKHKMAKHSIDYHKIKDYIDHKVNIPKNIFDPLFEKYCKSNDNSFKLDNSFKKKNWKGDYSRKNKKGFRKSGTYVTEDHNATFEKIVEIEILDSSKVTENVNKSDSNKDRVKEQNNKRYQTTFSYKELPSDKTNINGDWFLKAGESRSKIRWSHHRGDWWFDRASHRRRNPHQSKLKRKFMNWYFGRVWARQKCRHNSCNLSQEDTLGTPSTTTIFR